MSKLGQKPVLIPAGVTLALSEGNKLQVKGPKGELILAIHPQVAAGITEGQVLFETRGGGKFTQAIQGTTRALLLNALQGVTQGWSKQLELVGTGYRAEVNGKTLVLTVGFSHPVKIEAPEGINFKVEKSVVTVDGLNRELVGQVAANIRKVRPPEPYKGKGIKYVDEVIRRKAGKAAAKTPGA